MILDTQEVASVGDSHFTSVLPDDK